MEGVLWFHIVQCLESARACLVRISSLTPQPGAASFLSSLGWV